MSRFPRAAAVVILAASITGAIAASAMLAAPKSASAQAQKKQVGAAPKRLGIGREATADEIAGWDIDVRPDGTGLPKGRGSVAAAGTVTRRSRADRRTSRRKAAAVAPPGAGPADSTLATARSSSRVIRSATP